MEISDIRDILGKLQTPQEKAARFRKKRVARIKSGNIEIPLDMDAAKMILHFIPEQVFNPEIKIDFEKMVEVKDRLHTISTCSGESRINFDGLLQQCGPYGEGDAWSYSQLFRSGAIEIVDLCSLGSEKPNFRKEKLLLGKSFEDYLTRLIDGCLDLLKILEVKPPAILGLTLIGLSGYRITWDNYNPGHRGYSYDSDSIELPEIVIDSYEEKANILLSPSFNMIWNAFGLSRP